MALSAGGMRALRAAALLAQVVPSVRVRIRDGNRVVCTVSSRPLEPTDAGGRWLRPCAFRSAVSRAHRLQRQGTRLFFMDMPSGNEPAIDIGLRTGDRVLPGAIYRVRAAHDQWLLLFMADLGPEACERAVAEALQATKRCDGGGPGGAVARRIGFHGDAMTELTVVHTLCRVDEAERAQWLMERLLGVCVAAEAIAELQGESLPSPDTRT